jgi:hypothetical protein
MNDAVHQVVHRSVHLLGERKLLGAQMLGWSDPTFVATETVAVAPAQ